MGESEASPLIHYCSRTNDSHFPRPHTLDVEVTKLLMSDASNREVLLQARRDWPNPLWAAVFEYVAGDIPAIQFMIETCPELLMVSAGFYDAMPLHTACSGAGRSGSGTPAPDVLIQLLVMACPAAASELTGHGNTALHAYFLAEERSPNHETVRALLHASPNSARMMDSDRSFSPLEVVCRRDVARDGHLSTASLECLIDAYPQALTARDSNSMGPTLLHRAAKRPYHIDVVRFLAAKCTSLLEDNDAQDQGSPLHWLCQEIDMDAARKVQYLQALAISMLGTLKDKRRFTYCAATTK